MILLAVVCAVQAGCGFGRTRLDQALLNYKPSEGGPHRIAEHYTVRFPDVLEVRVADRPAMSGERPVNVEGKIELAPGDAVRVEGKSLQQIVLVLADHLRCPIDDVRVRVVQHRSQRVFLHGEVKGSARVVSYVGPETVLEMLQRSGGITSGAAPEDIQVVRAHVAVGRAPEVFKVDLDAIVNKNDLETNVRLQPFDHIYVGQSPSSAAKKTLPPWLRPLYDRLFGLARPDDVREVIQPLRDRRRADLAHRADLAQRAAPRYTSPRSE